MSWLSKVLGNKEVKKKSMGFDEWFTGIQMCGKEIFEPYTDHNALKSYGSSSVVATCLNKIALAYPEAPLYIESKSTGEELDTKDTQSLLDLLSRPNPNMNYGTFMRVVLQQFLLTGVVYIEKERNESGRVVALWPYPSIWVSREVDLQERKVVSYKVRIPGDANTTPIERKVAPEDMIRTFLPDPCNPYSPMGVLQAAMHDVNTDTKRESYIGEMLTNAIVLGAVVRSPEGLDASEVKAIRAKLESSCSAEGKNRGNFLILEGKEVTVETKEALKDLDWHGLSNLSESRICAVFGVPPTITHLRVGLENSPYSHIDHAIQIFYRDTMSPLWRMFSDTLTTELCYREGDIDTLIKHDLRQVKQLNEDSQEVSTRVRGERKDGLITRNEARELLGYEKIEGILGDTYIVGNKEVLADGTIILNDATTEEVEDESE